MKATIHIEGNDALVENVCAICRMLDERNVQVYINYYPTPIFKNHNWSGKTPMHFIHAVCLERNLSFTNISDNDILYVVQEAFKSENFIKLIKIVRELTGMGLKESKDWVEKYLS